MASSFHDKICTQKYGSNRHSMLDSYYEKVVIPNIYMGGRPKGEYSLENAIKKWCMDHGYQNADVRLNTLSFFAKGMKYGFCERDKGSGMESAMSQSWFDSLIRYMKDKNIWAPTLIASHNQELKAHGVKEGDVHPPFLYFSENLSEEQQAVKNNLGPWNAPGGYGELNGHFVRLDDKGEAICDDKGKFPKSLCITPASCQCPSSDLLLPTI